METLRISRPFLRTEPAGCRRHVACWSRVHPEFAKCLLAYVALCPSLRMQVLPRCLGHHHMQRHRFTIGVEGPLCLPIRRHHQPSISFAGLFTNESVVFAKSSPLFSLTSPRYSPQSPSFSPTSLRYSPTSLSFIPASPRCKFISRHCLSSLTEKFHF